MTLLFSDLNHALRVPLAAEVHSRPFLRLEAPEVLTHIAVYEQTPADATTSNGAAQHAMLAALCTHFGVSAPTPEAKYFFHDVGRFRLKWECHTEFAAYTFAERHDDAPSPALAFQRAPIRHVPQQWLASLQGKLMVAAHVVFDKTHGPFDVFAAGLRQLFEGILLAGSHVLQGGEIWTDFLILADGRFQPLRCA